MLKPVFIEEWLWWTVYSGEPWVAWVTLSRHIFIWHHILCLMSIFIDLVCIAVEKDHRRRSWRRCGWLRKPEMDLPGPANGSKTKMFRFWAIQESHNNQVRLRFKTFSNGLSHSDTEGCEVKISYLDITSCAHRISIRWIFIRKLKISSKFRIGSLRVFIFKKLRRLNETSFSVIKRVQVHPTFFETIFGISEKNGSGEPKLVISKKRLGMVYILVEMLRQVRGLNTCLAGWVI